MLLNANTSTRVINALIVGDSGTGKTHFGVTAPDPVILLAEVQGFETIKDAARLLDKPRPPTFLIRHRDDFRKAIITLATSKEPIPELVRHFADSKAEADKAIAELPYTKPKTVVVDSMTEILALVFDHITEQAPPKTAKDGLPDVGVRYWGTFKDRASTVIRAVRDLPYHVVMITLLDDREVGEGDEKSRVLNPMTPMKGCSPMLRSATNIVGIMRLRIKRAASAEEQATLIRTVQTAGPDWMCCKPMRPLLDTEVPDFSDWVRRLEAAHASNVAADQAAETETETDNKSAKTDAKKAGRAEKGDSK